MRSPLRFLMRSTWLWSGGPSLLVSGQAFTIGIQTYKIDGVPVRIYSPEKTIADCFKYRNKIGLDTAIEALKLYRGKKHFKADDLVKFARACRVEKIIRPYLEALL
jgi:predicted transcriptional regulator of viral defense system